MRFLILAFLSAGAAVAFSGCATVNDSSAASGGGAHLEPIAVTLAGTMQTANAAGPGVPITANGANDPTNRGVQWFLQVPTPTGSPINCAPTCGTMIIVTPFSVTYVPPPTVPGTLILPGSMTPTDFSSPMIIAVATSDNTKSASDAFKIQGAANRALVGDLISQTGGGTFSAATLSADLLASSGGSATLAIPNATGFVTPADGSFTGLVDLTSPANAKLPVKAVLAPNQSFEGMYTVVDPVSGRGTAMIPGAFFGQLDPVSAVST